MTFLPVVERELRVLSRNRRVYLSRFISAQVALGVVAWFWFTFAGRSPANAAKEIFATLSGLAFGYCLILGMFLTADSISEEKREGTLGLLFLTDLKGYDVALGKLSANSLQAIYNLLAIFPILTIPLLLGGLTGSEIFRMSLALLNALVFSLTVGLLVSTLSQHDRKAQATSFGIILFFSAVIPALVAFLRYSLHFNTPEFLYLLSPAFTMSFAFENRFVTKPGAFWVSLMLVQGLSWCAFFLSAFWIRRVWQDRPSKVSGGGWRQKLWSWKRGSSVLRARYRCGLLSVNPYYWVAARDRWKPYYVLVFLGACGIFWLLLLAYNRRDMLEQEAFFLTAVVLHSSLKVWLASEAGRQFFEDRKNSALELTLSTPMPVRELLEGHFLALVRQFGPAVAIILVFDVIGLVIGARNRFTGADTEWLLTWISAMIIFVVDVVTIGALGLWLGLNARRFSRAIAKNLFYVLLLPWIVFFVLIAFMAFSRMPSLNSLTFVIGLYFVICLVTDLILFLNASGNLTSRFREIAADK